MTETSTLGTFMITNNTVSELKHGAMEEFTMEAGKTKKNTVMVTSQTKTV